MKKLVLLLLVSYSGCAYPSPLERLVRCTEPKVVKIGIITAEDRGVCSGAIVTESGIVLTCAHCFKDKGIKKVFIKTSEGRVFLAQPLFIDPKTDLALIAPQTYQGKFKYFKLGKSPVIGQEVISFGSPLGIQHTCTIGHIANMNKKSILHSAFVNPGNSGGPLVDLKGRLIGLNEATIRMDIFQDAQGLFVAINLAVIKAFLGRK